MISKSTRRAFLTTTALGVASMAVRARAQRPGSRAWIDVHHHILPPAYVEAVGSAAIGAPGGRTAAPQWSVELALETMDSTGIVTALTSVSAPALVPRNDGAAERQRVRRLVRGFNEFSRKMAVEHPRRFGTFATLCLPDVDGSLTELAYAYDQLRVEGVVLLTNYSDRYLGDPSFIPLFDELNRRKAVVFVHPNICACMGGASTRACRSRRLSFHKTRSARSSASGPAARSLGALTSGSSCRTRVARYPTLPRVWRG